MLHNLFYCEHCSEVFSNTTGDFTEHMESHSVIKPTNVFACHICEKKLSSQAILNEHMRIHTGEKPFKCTYCPEAFRAKRTLAEHNRLHNGKGFTCTICHKSFTNKKNFENHKWIHTGEKSFKCSYCEKSCISPANLYKHHKTHTIPKPYACKYCKQAFTEQKNCDIHMKFHTENRTYACEICNEKFNYAQSLYKHLRAHTGQKPYSCEQCKKTYVSKKRLHKHYNVRHTMENSEKSKILPTPVETALKDHVYFQTVRRCVSSFETVNDAMGSSVGFVKNEKNQTKKQKNIAKKVSCTRLPSETHLVNSTNERKTLSNYIGSGPICPVLNTESHVTQDSKDNMVNVEKCPVGGLGKDSSAQTQSTNLEEYYENCMNDYSTSPKDNFNDMHADPTTSDKIKSNNCTESGSINEGIYENHTGYRQDHAKDHAVLPEDVNNIKSRISDEEYEESYIDDVQTNSIYFGDNHFNHAQGFTHSVNDHTYCKETVSKDSMDSEERIENRKNTIPNGKKAFSCAHCSRTFDRSRFLLRHLLLHMGNNVCPCEHCSWKGSIRKHSIAFGKTYKNSIKYKNTHKNVFRNDISHEVDSDNQNNYPPNRNSCQSNIKYSTKKKCNQSIASLNYATTPLKRSQHHQKKAIVSVKRDQDEIISNNYDNINNSPRAQGTLASNPEFHLNIIDTKKTIYECKECNKSYTSRHGISYHKQTAHGSVYYTCKHCFKEISGRLEYREHLLVHKAEKKFTCQYCPKSFRQKKNLVTHLRIHTGEKPFSCMYCEKSFRHKEVLSKHMKMHTGKNLYPCNYCEKKFVHKFSLSEHIRFHTGEKPFVCPHCQRAFSRIFSYTHHLKLHTIARPFSCHYCKKGFTTKKHRDSHLRFHEHNRNKIYEELFSCSLCTKTFCTKNRFEMHVKTHTSESYSCLECKKKFTYETNLKKHVIAVHKRPFKDTPETKELLRQDKPIKNFPDDALSLLLQLAEIPVTDVYIQTT